MYLLFSYIELLDMTTIGPNLMRNRNENVHSRGRHHGDHGGPSAWQFSHQKSEMGRRHGARGPGRRLFGHGDLRLVALRLIHESPRYGYEIIKAIEEQSGGAYTPSAGAVYPTLTLLQELGHLTVAEDGEGRKLYTITEEGKASLVANRKSVDAIMARIAEAIADEAPSRPIVEAFREVKQSLRARMARAPFDEAHGKLIIDKLNDLRDTIAKD